MRPLKSRLLCHLEHRLSQEGALGAAATRVHICGIRAIIATRCVQLPNLSPASCPREDTYRHALGHLPATRLTVASTARPPEGTTSGPRASELIVMGALGSPALRSPSNTAARDRPTHLNVPIPLGKIHQGLPSSRRQWAVETHENRNGSDLGTSWSGNSTMIGIFILKIQILLRAK